MVMVISLVIISLTTGIVAAERYTIKTGDTLWSISQKFGVTIESIISNNNLKNPNNIYIGQKLIIKKDDNDDRENKIIRYTVNPGDVLWKIAERYGITVRKIIDINNLQSPYYIYIGQTLLIPVKDTQNGEEQINKNYFYYTVKPGDILWNIAQKYGTTVKRLVKLNKINNSYDLYVGRKLIVPRNSNPTDDVDDDNQNDNNANYVPYTFYKISEGDQIWTIADHFGLKVSTLVNYNNIDNLNNIEPGEVLIIPLRKSNKFNYLKKTSRKLNNYYRVKSNETLNDIAQYFNVPEEGIRAINKLTSNEEVYTGQKLLMPVSQALFKKHEIYKVKSGGEYIFDIAYNYGISIRSILQSNYMTNKNIKFAAGTVIIVPLDERSKATWIDYENGKPVNSWF